MSNFPFEDVWSRVKNITSWVKLGELANFLDISQSSVSGAKQKRDSFPLEWAFKIAQEFNCTTDWLLTGKNPETTEKKKQPSATKTQLSEPVTATVNIQELLNMTAEVLVSDTVFHPALTANIKAFHRSINLEKDKQALQSRVEKLETERLSTEDRLASIEKGMEDNNKLRDEIVQLKEQGHGLVHLHQ